MSLMGMGGSLEEDDRMPAKKPGSHLTIQQVNGHAGKSQHVLATLSSGLTHFPHCYHFPQL